MTPEAAIAALTASVDAPWRPARPRDISWLDFERENGFAPPTDYRLLMEHYGVGSFGTSAWASLGGWMYLLDPFDAAQSLVDQSEWERRNVRGLQRQFPELSPGWSVWPEPGGLLPWGGTIDGDLVGWWTRGVPDEWGTRFFGRADEFEEFRFGIAEFILRLYLGELGAPALDGRLHSLDDGETPQFFRVPGPRPPREPVREEVSVSFAGLASAIDPASVPSSSDLAWAGSPEELKASAEAHSRRFAAAMRPAQEIFDSWQPAAEQVGVRVHGLSHASGTHGDPPLHHELRCSFEPEAESEARRLVVELSERLGVAIADAHNLENDRIWEDISTPRTES